jgi:hypothetical protein
MTGVEREVFAQVLKQRGGSAASGRLQMLSNMESHPEEWEDKSIGKI